MTLREETIDTFKELRMEFEKKNAALLETKDAPKPSVGDATTAKPDAGKIPVPTATAQPNQDTAVTMGNPTATSQHIQKIGDSTITLSHVQGTTLAANDATVLSLFGKMARGEGKVVDGQTEKTWSLNVPLMSGMDVYGNPTQSSANIAKIGVYESGRELFEVYDFSYVQSQINGKSATVAGRGIGTNYRVVVDEKNGLMGKSFDIMPANPSEVPAVMNVTVYDRALEQSYHANDRIQANHADPFQTSVYTSKPLDAHLVQIGFTEGSMNATKFMLDDAHVIRATDNGRFYLNGLPVPTAAPQLQHP